MKKTFRVAIGTSSFASKNKKALSILESTGCEITMNPYGRKLTEDETIELIKDADGLLAGLEPLNYRVLSSAPKLKAIARVGIGMDNVDFDAVKKLNIKISNTPEAPTDTVAEMTLAAMLCLCRNVKEADESLHQKNWSKTLGLGLKDTKVFLVGYGRIGSRVSELLKCFGAEVLIYDPYLEEKSGSKDFSIVTLEEGLSQAQIISLHAGGNQKIMGSKEFDKMNRGVILLNSARGELIDEEALIEALDKGIVSKLWMDAYWEEPYKGALTDYKQVLMTPHMSTYTEQCRFSMEVDAVNNLLRDLEISI